MANAQVKRGLSHEKLIEPIETFQKLESKSDRIDMDDKFSLKLTHPKSYQDWNVIDTVSIRG